MPTHSNSTQDSTESSKGDCSCVCNVAFINERGTLDNFYKRISLPFVPRKGDRLFIDSGDDYLISEVWIYMISGEVTLRCVENDYYPEYRDEWIQNLKNYGFSQDR